MRTRNAKLQLNENNSNRTTIVSNLLFIVGICITFPTLIYMIVNLDKADSIITMWISIMAIGVSLLYGGFIFRLIAKKSPERKIRNFTLRSTI